MHEQSARERAAELSFAYRAAERDRSYRGGFIIFLASESMFFVSLLASRFVLAGTGHPANLDQSLAVAVTVVMVASLAPATRMGLAAARGHWTAVQWWASLAALAGLGLLAGVAWEWYVLTLGPQGRYGGIYYLTVGMHALHVFIAVLVLAGVAARARVRAFSAGSLFGVEAARLFWYLVASLWLAVWAVFYLA